MILSTLYTTDAENNRCTWTPPPLLHKRNTALGLLLYFRVDGVQPIQAQSFQVWVSMVHHPPASPSTWLQHLRSSWYWSPTSWHHRNLGVHFDSCM